MCFELKRFGRRNEQRPVREHNRRSTPSIHLGWLRLLSAGPTLFGCLGWLEGFEPACVKIDPALYSKIIRDTTLSDGAFRLWHLLRDMTGANSCCWPSVRTVSKLIGCNKNSVLARIIELEAAGYLRIERAIATSQIVTSLVVLEIRLVVRQLRQSVVRKLGQN